MRNHNGLYLALVSTMIFCFSPLSIASVISEHLDDPFEIPSFQKREEVREQIILDIPGLKKSFLPNGLSVPSELPLSSSYNDDPLPFDFNNPTIMSLIQVPCLVNSRQVSSSILNIETIDPRIYDKFSLRVRHLGPNLRVVNTKIPFPVDKLTGFDPSTLPIPVSPIYSPTMSGPLIELRSDDSTWLSQWQRGPSIKSPKYLALRNYTGTGAAIPQERSVFQWLCRDVGSFINTSTFDHSEPVRGGGPHSVLEYRFKEPYSFWDGQEPENNTLTLQAYVEIPHVATQGGAVGQLSFFFYLQEVPVQDETTSTSTGNSQPRALAYVINIFDNRPEIHLNLTEFIGHDTFTSFVSTPLNYRSRYSTSSPFSEGEQTYIPWQGLKFFRVHITPNNLVTALTDLNTQMRDSDPNSRPFSLNLQDYQLKTVGMLHEVFPYFEISDEISMGVHIKEFGVYKFY